MQTFKTKKAAIAYAKQMGWTEADAERAFEGLPRPIDEMALLNLMVRFAGPVMKELGGAEKSSKPCQSVISNPPRLSERGIPCDA